MSEAFTLREQGDARHDPPRGGGDARAAEAVPDANSLSSAECLACGGTQTAGARPRGTRGTRGTGGGGA